MNNSFICPSPLVSFNGDGPSYTTTLVAFENCAISCPNITFGNDNWLGLQRMLCYMIWISTVISGVVLYRHLQDFNRYYIRIMFILGFFIYSFVLFWYGAFNYNDQITCYSENRFIERAGMCIFASVAVIWSFIWINTWSAILAVDTFLHVNLTLKLDSLAQYKTKYTIIGFTVPTIVTLIPLCAGNLGFDPKGNVPICFYLLSQNSNYFAYLFMPVYCFTFVVSLGFTIACALKIHTVLISSNHYKSYEVSKNKQISRRFSGSNKNNIVVEMSSAELCSEMENGRNVFDSDRMVSSSYDVRESGNVRLSRQTSQATTIRNVIAPHHAGWKRYGHDQVVYDSNVDTERSSVSSVFTPQYNDPFTEVEGTIRNPISESVACKLDEDGTRFSGRGSGSGPWERQTPSVSNDSSSQTLEMQRKLEDDSTTISTVEINTTNSESLPEIAKCGDSTGVENKKAFYLQNPDPVSAPEADQSPNYIWIIILCLRRCWSHEPTTPETEEASRMMSLLGAIWRFNGRSLILIAVYGINNCIGIPLLALSLLVNFNSYINSQQSFVDCLVNASIASPVQTQDAVNSYSQSICGSYPQHRPSFQVMGIVYSMVALYPIVPLMVFGLNRSNTNMTAPNIKS